MDGKRPTASSGSMGRRGKLVATLHQSSVLQSSSSSSALPPSDETNEKVSSLNAGNIDALRRLMKQQALQQVANVVKATREAAALLEDPKTPSIKDLDRWWPGEIRTPSSPGTFSSAASPLVVFPKGVGRSPEQLAALPSKPATPERDVRLPSRSPISLGNSSLRRTAPPARGSIGSGSKIHQPPKKTPLALHSSKSPRTASTLSSSSMPALPTPLPDQGKSRPRTSMEGNHPAAGSSYHPATDEAFDAQVRLSDWMEEFSVDEHEFKSKAVFVEMRLRQALRSSAMLGAPNTFRCAIVCDAFERIAPLTGRYEAVLSMVWREIIRVVFSDFTEDLPGLGAKVYAERVPYFLEAKRLREENEKQQHLLNRINRDREAERSALEERNKLISKTLGSWHRAMGAAAANKDGDELRSRIEALEKLLTEANEEITKLHEEASMDGVARCIRAFDDCDPSQKEEVLAMHILSSEAAATVNKGSSTAEVTGRIMHMLSELRGDAAAVGNIAEATKSRVLQQLLGEISMTDGERLALLEKLLADFVDPKMVGSVIAQILVGTGKEHVDAVAGITDRLHNRSAGIIGNDDDALMTSMVRDALAFSLNGTIGGARGGFGAGGVGGVGGVRGGAGGLAGSEAGGVREHGNHGSALNDLASNPAALAAEMDAAKARIAELQRRQAAGELSDEELAELERLEGQLADLERVAAGDDGHFDADGNWVAGGASGGSGMASDPAALAEEMDAAKARIAELKRRRDAGELTDEELAELERLEGRLADLEKMAEHMSKSSQEETDAVEARISELKRRQAAGELTDEELAELAQLEDRLEDLKKISRSKDRRGRGGKRGGRDSSTNRGGKVGHRQSSSKGLMVDAACQAGTSQLLSRGGSMGFSDASENEQSRGNKKLPSVAVTSLCEIKFNRKDVNAMNTLMCRRLVSALYQVYAEHCVMADREGRQRQGLPEFVPDQFVVLYGVKSLAIKNINSFLYGVRAERRRKTVEGVEENEPLLHFFWRACHHGVPMEDRISSEVCSFYVDLLAMVAKVVGDEHTLNLKSSGAFWNTLGSMNEMQFPLFVYVNVLQKIFGHSGKGEERSPREHPELLERVKRAVQKRAAEWAKIAKGPNPPKPCPSYKPMIVGSAELDSRGHLPIEDFMRLALEGAAAQQAKDAKLLQAIYAQWEKSGGTSGFDVFADMLTASFPDMPEDKIVMLYHQATSGEDPDSVDMSLVENELRMKYNITPTTLKRPVGTSSLDDGVADLGDLKAAAKGMSVLSAFGSNPAGAFARKADEAKGELDGDENGNLGGFKKASREAGKARGLIRDLFEADDLDMTMEGPLSVQH